MNMITLSDVIEYSEKNNVGIGMFNIVNLEFAKAIFDAAQETKVPAMLGVPERFFLQEFYDVESMAAACRAFAKQGDTPVALHLDHGKSFDGVMRALKAGFSSVMFDGSLLDYEDNIAQTKEIVKIAHAMGVSVEGELGYVGSSGKDEIIEDGFTSPDQAMDFAERTGVDALAVAIGNQHGVYKGEPRLDFERLAAIKSKVKCGIVLHGGTGISEHDFVKVIDYGVSKVNIYTAMDVAAKKLNNEEFGNFATYLDYTKALTQIVKEVVKDHILLFAKRKQVQ